ncbi:hypothetical protein ABTZ99_37325 [Actinosynnema sp. NPDC002837]
MVSSDAGPPAGAHSPWRRTIGMITSAFARHAHSAQAREIVNNTVNTVTVTEGGTLAGHVLQTGSLTGDVDITG